MTQGLEKKCLQVVWTDSTTLSPLCSGSFSVRFCAIFQSVQEIYERVPFLPLFSRHLNRAYIILFYARGPNGSWVTLVPFTRKLASCYLATGFLLPGNWPRYLSTNECLKEGDLFYEGGGGIWKDVFVFRNNPPGKQSTARFPGSQCVDRSFIRMFAEEGGISLLNCNRSIILPSSAGF